MCEVTYRCCVAGVTLLPNFALLLFAPAVILMALASPQHAGYGVTMGVCGFLICVSVSFCVCTGVLIRKYQKKKREAVMSGDRIVVTGIPPPNTTTYRSPSHQGYQPSSAGSQPPAYSSLTASDMQK